MDEALVPHGRGGQFGSTRHTSSDALLGGEARDTPLERHGMTESGPDPWPRGGPLEPRLQRTLHLAYAVDGVVAVRVWQWGPNVAIGVRGSGASSPADLVRRVEAAVAGLREPGEAWDFGVLEEPACGGPTEVT
jgi:hypothetical protein